MINSDHRAQNPMPTSNDSLLDEARSCADGVELCLLEPQKKLTLKPETEELTWVLDVCRMLEVL